MRPSRVTRASRPALLAFSIGPWPGTWTAHIFDDLKVLGCRRSTRTYCRHDGQNRINKGWVPIAGAPRLLPNLVKLCQLSGAAHYSSGSSGRSSGGRRRDPSLIYGAGWEGGGEDVPVAVWWDFENCNVPQGIEVYKVGVNIVSGLRLSGFKGPVSISAYGDTLQLSRSTQEALASTGIRVHHVPSGGKDSSDRALLVDLILWTFDHRPPAHLFLISGDRDFSNALHRLRMRNYNILLACPSGTTISPALLGAATHVWQWNSLVRGEGLLQTTSPDGPSGGGFYSRHGGPRPYTSSYSPVSVGYNGSGPSSEGCMTATQMQVRTGEGNSVSLVRKSETTAVSPSLSSQKQTLKDTSQASATPKEGVAESSNGKRAVRQPPKKVLQQFRCLLMSHPDGMMLADLQNYIRDGKLNFEKDFYGHGKVMPFLSSIPEIVQLERVLSKDNKSWSYNLFLTQESPKSRTEGSERADSAGVANPSGDQAGERTPLAPATSSQVSSQTELERRDSTSQMKQDKLESPGSSPSQLRSGDLGQDKILSTDGLPQPGQSTTQIYEELGVKYPQSDIQPNDSVKDKEGYVQADGLSSGWPTSVSDLNQETSNLSKEGTSLPAFLGSFVDSLRNWQSKRTGAEDPNLPHQGHVHANLNDKDNRVDQAENFEIRSTEYATGQRQFRTSDTSSVGGLRCAEGIIEAGMEEGKEGVSRDEDSEVLSADKQLMSRGMYGNSEVVANDVASIGQVNKLDGELVRSRGSEGTSSVVSPEDRKPTWKRWLFGPTNKDALSEVEVKASPELNQESQAEAVPPALGCKEAKVDCELSKESVTRSEEPVSTQPVSSSPPLDTGRKGDEKLLRGHSSEFRQESKSDGTRNMKVLEELEEYVNSAEGTLLLSNASNLTEAVHLIRTKGSLRFQSLDSNQISAVVGPFTKEQGFDWEFHDDSVSSSGAVPGPVGSLQGNAEGDLLESKSVADIASQAQGKDIRIGDGIGSSIQKNEEIDETKRDKPSPETGHQSNGRHAFQDLVGPSSTVSPAQLDGRESAAVSFESTAGSWQQYTEAGSSHITSTTSINGTKTVHPSFEEFEEWFLRVVNSAFKRSARIEKVGYDLSLVKPEFEKEFGVRLDSKLYGFSRVQDLVASVESVRLSRPRIDQCTIHLLKTDAKVSEQANQNLDEQVEESNGSVGSKPQYWPKMYHDCKALVRDLMMENPEGIRGIKLKPLFSSRFNYYLDHKRVGYTRMSDLLRLMPDVVSVNGKLLVPSKEFLRSLREEERTGKRVMQNVAVEADSEDLPDYELFSESRSGRGENWSEIDKEADGSPPSGNISGETSEDGQISLDQDSCGPNGLEKHSSRREVLDDLCLSSEDESDSAESDFQDHHLQYFDEDVLQREVKRIIRPHIAEESGSLGSSKDYDFSDEIDELLLEDSHSQEISEEHACSAGLEPENVKEGRHLSLDGHLHEDWAAELEGEIQETSELPLEEEIMNSDGSGVTQHEETRDGGQTSVSSAANEEDKNFDRNTSTSVSDTTPREESVSVASRVDEQTQEERNSMESMEHMRILQGKEEHSRPLEESLQVDQCRFDSPDEPAAEEPSGRTNARDGDVFCYTPSAESGRQAEDSNQEPNPSTKIESRHLTAPENVEGSTNTSAGSEDQREEGDNTGRSSSREVASKKSIWGRLFK